MQDRMGEVKGGQGLWDVLFLLEGQLCIDVCIFVGRGIF